MPETAGIHIGWTRLQQQDGLTIMDVFECRLPVDASQRVKERMLAAAIGKWLRWQTGRGWHLVSDIHVGKARTTLDIRAKGLREGSNSCPVTGVFEYRGLQGSRN